MFRHCVLAGPITSAAAGRWCAGVARMETVGYQGMASAALRWEKIARERKVAGMNGQRACMLLGLLGRKLEELGLVDQRPGLSVRHGVVCAGPNQA